MSSGQQNDRLQTRGGAIAGKRGVANVPDLGGSTADVTVYLAGRLFSDVTPQTGHHHPIFPWL